MSVIRKSAVSVAVVASLLAVAACSSLKNIETKPAEVNPTDMPKGPGLLSGESGNILSAFKSQNSDGSGSGGNIGVNAYLWRAALEAVSFMPITQADSNGGVITTDWYTSPQAPDERVKTNILILGKSLRVEALKVTLFKQTRDAKGAWTDAPVSEATRIALEDAILTKARVLKVQSLSK